MEQILQHYIPNISFDLQSLRKTAEELKHKHRGSDSDGGPSIRLDEEDFEDLAIDDEDFTIKALPDNTTRMSHLALDAVKLSYLERWTKQAICRILRGIFLLEFLHED